MAKAHVTSGEAPQYDAAAKFKPLFEKSGTPQSFLMLLLEEVKPYVPLHILTGDEPEKHIGKLLKVFEELSKRYADILYEASDMGVNVDLAKVAERVRSGKVRDLSSIWREAKAAAAGQKTFEQLSSLRDEMDAEFLACLGFLPSSIFLPKDGEAKDSTLLKDTISPYVKSGAGISDQMSLAAIRRHASDSQLHQWIGAANKDFQDSVAGAFGAIRTIAKKNSPKKGMESQLSEPLSDFDTKHFADLLVLILDPKLAPIKRFEALRLLKWSIGFFSVQRNPVYQALHAARTAIHDLLQAEFWSTKGEFEMVKLPNDIIYAVINDVEKRVKSLLDEMEEKNATKKLKVATGKKVRKIMSDIVALKKMSTGKVSPEFLKEFNKLAGNLINLLDTGATEEADNETDQDSSIRMKARKVRTEVQALLGGRFFAANTVLFASRGKNIPSIVTKVEILQALVEACSATLSGEKVDDLSITKATEKLAEIKERMLERGHTESDIKTKPVGYDVLDDQVGLSLVFNFKKPLELFSEQQQRDLDAQFKEIAEHVIGIIPLKRLKIENHLWHTNGANPKSSKAYRLYKIHGEYEITANVFDEDGRIIPKTVSVPVEIQLQPIETFLRANLDPQTSHAAYERKKALALAPSAFPPRVGEVGLYDFVNTPSGSIGALMDVDDQGPTS